MNSTSILSFISQLGEGDTPLWLKIVYYVVPMFSGSIMLYFTR